MSEELIGAYDIRGTKETGLTVECAWNVGKALADWLPTSGNVVVVATSSQQDIAGGVIEGLRLQGRNVVDGGNGDKETAVAYVKTAGLSGAAVVGFDDATGETTIELYREEAKRIDSDSGLGELHELIEAANFVPAVTKGQLIHFA